MIRLPRSLQGRLTAIVLAVVACVWLAMAALTWIDARHELDELLDSHLAQAAALLVVQNAGDIDDQRRPDAPVLHRYAPKVAFQVFHEGRLALRSANAPDEPMLAPGSGFRSGLATVSVGGVQWRVFAAYGAERDIQVYVGEQASSRAAILRAVLRGTLWPMMVALPLLALAMWWAVRRGTAPLRRLGRMLAERQPEALQPVLLTGLSSEMEPMIEALNRLFGRIAALLESERRFTADAAHELRTPIAAIRIQAQVALAETDDALRRRALRATLEGCDRAARLVDQLLTLSRLEADRMPPMAALDLYALVQRVVAELVPKALARGQALEVEASAACRIAGNDTLLAVLVRNLVDNASRYSPHGARVRVGLLQKDGRFVLSVEDSGPGLPESDRRRLGERFFRAPGNGESGSGLGWSIVKRIAEAHGFELDIGSSAALGGLAVHVKGRFQPGAQPE
jgi:two-component system sensor histidine kinase QseC